MKKKTKTKRILEEVGHELKVNEPSAVAKTRAKKGAKAARKQEVAIMLSKARSRGARIPKKKVTRPRKR